MKALKHIIAITAVFSAIFQMHSQALSAQEVMENTAAKLNSSKSITAKFISTADGQSAKGSMTIARERFNMLAEGYCVWYDGVDMWSFYKSSGEVSLTTPTTDELLEINPFDIVNQYANRFTVRMGQKTPNSLTVILNARSTSASIKTASLTVNDKTWLPTNITATFANGQTLTIDINDVQIGTKELSKQFFQFPASKYPGAEIIDLR